MRTSRNIGEIAKALAAMQAEIKNPTKQKTAKIESTKGAFTYTYADFAAALDEIRPLLSKHNLSFTQNTVWHTTDGKGIVLLETRLMHESGEWIEGDYPVSGITTHREMGSSLSYARRYALFSMIGIQGEDDDDGAVDERGAKKRAAAQEKGKPAPVGPAMTADEMVKKIGQFQSLPNLNAWLRQNVGAYERLSKDDQKRVHNKSEGQRAFLASQPLADEPAGNGGLGL